MKAVGLLRRLALWWWLLPLGVLASCTSVYEGTRMTPDGGIGVTDRAGVPFTMLRTEYRVVRDGSGDPQKYKIDFSNVPDPDRRYTIRMSPALLASVSFSVTLTRLRLRPTSDMRGFSQG
ncbi:MAG: hypothetical protein QM674_20515, partial [Burkholderiaceae bacterium]